ncbi:hypothetical protein ZIOFF_043837 [Zingiber officinale]|uniref:Uncharacterized protein n=1 Tax=Zingiber officinale TaxID=94328 RepID=A0A8J5FW21_ZINOF|nr:hypothetical protein ZIOFF_043837 [Zingiber officinale]
MESQDGGGNGSRTPAEKKLFDDWLAGKRSGLMALDHERKKGVPWTQEEHRLFLQRSTAKEIGVTSRAIS